MAAKTDLTDLAVVIPTLNAAERLGACLDALAREAVLAQVVVADGGSIDGTAALAAARDCTVIQAPAGRGSQLRAGVAETTADWLLILHADTVLEAGWAAALRDVVDRPRALERVACFRFALDDPAPAARRLERMVAWRTRVLGLPYGDQGVVVHRVLYDQVGGFRPIPLMEDVDLIRRLGRWRVVPLSVAAVTDAARFRRDGYYVRSARNLMCLALYLVGVPPRWIKRLYG